MSATLSGQPGSRRSAHSRASCADLLVGVVRSTRSVIVHVSPSASRSGVQTSTRLWPCSKNRVTQGHTSAPAAYAPPVPDNAEEVAIYFQATDRNRTTHWESRYGENYRYPVVPALFTTWMVILASYAVGRVLTLQEQENEAQLQAEREAVRRQAVEMEEAAGRPLAGFGPQTVPTSPRWRTGSCTRARPRPRRR